MITNFIYQTTDFNTGLTQIDIITYILVMKSIFNFLSKPVVYICHFLQGQFHNYMTDYDTQFQNFLRVIESNNTYKTAVQSASKKYDLHYSDLSRLNPAQIRKLRGTLIQKQNNEQDFRLKLQQEWIECEKKLFVWVLVCFLAVHKKQIGELGENDFQQLSDLTTHKSIPLIKYMALGLIKPNKRLVWTAEQDEILLNLLSIEKKYKTTNEWSAISRELFLRGKQESVKNGKICRQRWCNHVDPNISKEWTAVDDAAMLKYIKQHGKRWAQIATQLKGTKNEHMVKNRYNSLMRRVAKGRSNLKEDQLIQIYLKNSQEEREEVEMKQQMIEKKETTNDVMKDQTKTELKNSTVIRLNSLQNEEDQQNIVRMITSKNYCPEGDVTIGLFDDVKFCPLLFKMKSDKIDEIRQESEEEKPKRKQELKLNQSCSFGNPSPIAPTPYPFFFQSPLPQQISTINKSFYNFSKFTTTDL